MIVVYRNNDRGPMIVDYYIDANNEEEKEI